MSLNDQLGFTFQAPSRRIWTVRDLVGAARTQLEREYTDVWVEGEISNYRPAESGHLYFTLKDDAAQIRVVMFRSQARLLRFKPDNGMHVTARGRVTIYEGRGELQISAEFLEPKGAGALQIAFEQLKAKLQAEGVFDAARKKPIPRLPKRIGVVTSPRGAALQDILKIIRRRHESVGVVIYPAQVQGDVAAAEVSAGIRYFNRARNVDVIVVARGGGSVEDLAAFNEEGLARVVAASQIPVISAIGHETDFTIIDFVADLRAPTPSAAAELVIESKHQIDEQVESLHRRLGRAVRYQLILARQELTDLAQHGAFARTIDLVRRRQQRVDDLSHRMASAERDLISRYRRSLDLATAGLRHRDLRRVLSGVRRDLDARATALASSGQRLLLKLHARMDHADARMRSLSPLAVLERGYALVFDASGNLIKDAIQVREGDSITARLARGRVEATVNKTRPE